MSENQRRQVCKKSNMLVANTLVTNTLVTGGVQGIGKSIVMALAARGDTVFVFDYISPDDERVKALKNQGIFYIQVDVSSVDSIKQGFEKLYNIIDELSFTRFLRMSSAVRPEGPSKLCEVGCLEGSPRRGDGCCATLDIFVNNAGITRDMLAVRMSEKDWDAVLDVNLKGSFFCAQQALKRMIKQPKSYIINIASVVGITGNPGQVNYAASKAGVIAMTKTLAKEYAGRNVLVNAIAPGFIQTKMTEKISDKLKQKVLELIPLKRLGVPQDVANMVAFLTSGNADYCTGQVLHVDGGMVV